MFCPTRVGEISLKNTQLCNLTEINVSDLLNQEDFNNRVRAAAFIGTLQASYTDFHYLRYQWQKTCEKEALLGIGMTGIASGKILVSDINMTEAANIAQEENKRVAELIGINRSARITTVKPSRYNKLCSSVLHLVSTLGIMIFI